jgi:hypothetical protein
MSQFGHHVIYRRYDLSQPASQDKITGEGQGQRDRWEFTDEVALSRQDATGITGTKGLVLDQSLFYFPATVNPKRGDVIITVLLPNVPSNALTLNDVLQAAEKERYRIIEVDTKRFRNGVLDHFICIVEPELGNY